MQAPNDLSPPSEQHLVIAAGPRWFDAAVLASLLDDAAQALAVLDRLIRHPAITADDRHPGRYRFLPAQRAELLASLETGHSDLYRTLQHRAVEHFLERCTTAPGSAQGEHEKELFYHLDRLFHLLIRRLDRTHELAEVLARVRKTPLLDGEHQATLAYYESCLYRNQGDSQRALHSFRQVANQSDISEALHARVLNSLGLLYNQLDRFDEARRAFLQSRDIWLGLGDATGQAKALHNLGIVYHRLGQYEEAQGCFRARLELAWEAGDRVAQGFALNELGYTAKELGQWQEALDYYQQSLRIWQERGMVGRVGQVSNNLGEVYHLTGRWQQAEDHYRQALAIFLDPQVDNPLEATDALHNLGFLHFTQGKLEQAETCYLEALQHARRQAGELPFAISQLHYRLGSLHRLRGALEEAYEALRVSIDQVEALRSREAREETRISLFGTRQQIYQAMVLLCLDLDRPDEAFTYAERARSRAFLDLLGSPRLEETLSVQMPLTAAQIQARLPVDAGLIAFFATGDAGPGRALLQHLPPESQHLRPHLVPSQRLLAFVATRDTICAVELSVNLQRLSAQFFNQDDGRLLGVTPLAGQRLHPMRRWQVLARQLLEPLQEFLHDRRHIFLVPHGLLHYLPLHGLSGGTGLWANDWGTTVSYAPSASILAWTGLKRGEFPSNPTRSLAIGVNDRRVDHSEAEAHWIATRLGGDALLGARANVETVCAAMGRYDIIHFSCHGHFRRRQPMQSGLALSGGELTASHVLQALELDAEIVTLAACDTGLSEVTHGDELLGLTRAFVGAGARSLLVTLWPVHEIPTRLFMERFYEAWGNGLSKSRALAEAQQDLRGITVEDLRDRLLSYGLSDSASDELLQLFSAMLPGTHPFQHPYYWGAYLLIGDPS